MVNSKFIYYVADVVYRIYTSPFKTQDFIETKLYVENLSRAINSIEEANAIKVSFNQYNRTRKK